MHVAVQPRCSIVHPAQCSLHAPQQPSRCPGTPQTAANAILMTNSLATAHLASLRETHVSRALCGLMNYSPHPLPWSGCRRGASRIPLVDTGVNVATSIPCHNLTAGPFQVHQLILCLRHTGSLLGSPKTSSQMPRTPMTVRPKESARLSPLQL